MKHGIQHIKNDSKLNIMLGVHNAHFAVENLLRKKAEHTFFEGSLSGISFKDIIQKVNKDSNIPQFEDLISLNSNRNNVQHKNEYPRHDRAIELVSVAENFLRWGYKMYFNADYDSLNLEDMIYDVPIKNVMLESKKAINDDDLKKAAWKMNEGLGAFKFMWFGYLSDSRTRDQIFTENLDMPNLLADLAFKIILSEDQFTLKKLLAIQSRWVMKEGVVMPLSNYGFYKFKDKEEALSDYDAILNIILTYQDKVPNWRKKPSE